MKNLYSPKLEDRYKATMASNLKLGKRWPGACTGAANAYLVLIGPSPGANSKARAVERPSGPIMEIRPERMTFEGWESNPSIPRRWVSLCASLLGGEQYVQPMTADFNLDWGHEGNQRNVAQDYLGAGLDIIWPLLKTVKPRIVMPLTRTVCELVITKIPGAALPKVAQPLRFKIGDCESLLLRPHNHPSRHFLTPAHIEQLGAISQEFLTT
jgi:hypothetical protein